MQIINAKRFSNVRVIALITVLSLSVKSWGFDRRDRWHQDIFGRVLKTQYLAAIDDENESLVKK